MIPFARAWAVRRPVYFVLLLLTGIILLSARPVMARDAKAERQDKKPRLVLFTPSNAPFWKTNVRYALAMAKSLGARMEVVDYRDDPAFYLENVERVCRQGADGIIFQSYQDTGEQVLKIAERYGTPSFLINMDMKNAGFLPRTKYKNWLGQMAPDDGWVGAMLIQQLLSQAGRSGISWFHILGIEGAPGHKSSIQRRKGLESFLKYTQDVGSLAILPGYWNPDRAAVLFKEYIGENPATNVVWCASDSMALAVADAADELGIEKPLFIGGVDWDPKALNAIREGRMSATVGGHFMEGAWAVLLLYDYLLGMDFASESIDFITPMQAITRDNLEDFSQFLALHPEEADFRPFSKVYNTERTDYTLDLVQMVRDVSKKQGGPVQKVNFSPEERAFLASHPKIRVGVMDTWPPMNFVDDAGRPSGIGADYIKALNQRLDGALEVVPGPFKQNLKQVKEKKLDALMDVSPKPERQAYLNFTRPYLTIPHVIVARKYGPYFASEPDLNGKTLAMEEGFYGVKDFQDNFPDVNVQVYPNTSMAIGAVSQGRADAYAGNRAAALWVMEKELISNLQIQGRLNRPASVLAMGVRKDWPQLAAILDKAMRSLAPDEVRTIQRQWADLDDLDTKRVRLTPEEKQWLKDHSVARVAGIRNFPPFNFKNQAGEWSGIGVEIFKIVARRIGLKIQPEMGTFHDSLEAVKEKRLDILPTMADLPTRREHLAFTKPYLMAPHVLAIRRGSPLHSARDLAGRRLALEKSFYTNDYVKKNMPDVKILEVDAALDALLAVRTGAADAYLGNITLVTFLIEQNHLPGLETVPFNDLEPFKISMGVRKDWAELAPILEKGLDSITVEERREIILRYIPLSEMLKKELVLTAAEKKWLKSHPRLRLGVAAGSPPFEFIDEKGNFAGITSEYVNWLGKKLGITLRPQTGPWQEILEAVRDKKIDVIPAIVQTQQREKFLNFTSPYIVRPMVVVMRRDAPYVTGLDMLAGKTLAQIRGHMTQVYLERDYPGLNLLLVDTPKEALLAVSQGRADAMLENSAVLAYLTRQMGIENLKIAAPAPYSYDLCFGVRKDMPELAVILEKALATVSEKENAVFHERWTNIRFAKQIDWSAVWTMVIMVAGVALVVVIVILWWNRRLASEITERKKIEQRLLESERKIRAMSQAMHDGLIMIDDRARVMYWNHAAEKLFGLPIEKTIGRDMHDLFVPEELKSKAAAGLKHFAKTGQGPVVDNLQEFSAIKADGTRFPVEVGVAAFQIQDQWYAVGTIRDITERKQAEAELKKLSKAVEQSPVSVVITDSRGTIEYVNPAFTATTGYTFTEPKRRRGHGPKSWRPRVLKSGKHSASFYRNLWATIIRGQNWHGEFVNRKKNGELYWESATISPILNKSGKIVRLVFGGETGCHQAQGG